MESLDLDGYRLSFDSAATASAYGSIQVPGPEECGCWYCRNWVALRERAVPVEVRALLDRFGVPLNGEIEVWEAQGDAPGRHLYGGWYTVVGTVQTSTGGPSPELELGTWRVTFSSGSSYTVAAFDEHPVFEMHFLTETDTIIDGGPNDPL